MPHFKQDDLTSVVARIAVSMKVPEPDAYILAKSLVWADASGASTHGVSRLGIYVDRIRRGLIDPIGPLTLGHQQRAVFAFDAGNGLGQVQACKVLDHILPVAREYGIAAATIRRSQHFGALAYYCELAATRGMILLAMTNCEPAMSPHGGCEAFFGTNPIAASFPTGKGFAIKIDMATSIIARGNIIQAKKLGVQIPLGWAIDRDGNPTTDPAAALIGSVLTMAGHKGYALALLVEVFSGVLSGAAVGSDIGSMYKDLDRPQNVGHFFCAVDIKAFMDHRQFIERIDRMIDHVRSCRKCNGVDEILIPGERSARNRDRAKRHGVPIDEATASELKDLCKRFEISWPSQVTEPAMDQGNASSRE